MDKITQLDIETAAHTRDYVKTAESKILDRIDYVLKEIYKAFGKKGYDYWYFDGAEEGEVGELPFIDYNDAFGDGELIISPQLKDCYALIESYEWDFENGSFPARWLFNDFEDELKVAVENYPGWKAEKKRQDKEKREAKKAHDKQMLTAIKAKLTPAEWKFLKVEANYKGLK